MRKSGAILAAIALFSLGIPQAHAVIVIASDYPMAEVRGGIQANGKGQLSQLVALYENDVAMMANSDKLYSKIIREAKADPAVEAELRKLAGTLSVESLAEAVTTMVKAAPENSLVIMASAINLMKGLEGGLSQENRVVLGKAALLSIKAALLANPDSTEKAAYYAALIIGVAAQGQEQADITKTVIVLRNFALNDLPGRKLGDEAPILDGALIKEGILTPTVATKEFVTLARAFNNLPAGEVPAGQIPPSGPDSGDQGGTNPGGPSAGAGGGSGSSTPAPTPKPGPTINPVIIPTPTPSPTPVS